MKKFLRTAVCCLAAILLCNGIIIGCSEYKKSDFAFGKHFKSGTPYTNGYAVVSEDDGEKVIDTDGKVIFSGNYDSIFIASPHLIGVEKAGKFGFMNLDGTTAIELQFYSAAPFSDGFARVTLRHGFGMQSIIRTNRAICCSILLSDPICAR
ncbi:MAG: WG repeat-containing protein [Candidatus Borkfalkia sp.]